MANTRRAIITSALPYANGEIHLGHVASTYLPADVTTRFLKITGVEAYYVCASDDFGTPILIQSERENKTPQQYAAHWNRRDCEDFAALRIGFDYFYKTSSPENIAFVQDVFRRLNEAGHIYEQEIIQFYCAHDKKFLPDRYVKGTCPYCGAEDQYSDLCESCGRIPEKISEPKCSLCGRPPTMEKTRHYFFKLGSFGSALSAWLDGNKNLQKDVKKYVSNWIDAGLKDWDITRDISWGVPVPLDDAHGKVFYGWFDNHLAYISTAVKFLEDKGIDGKQFWNSADIYHFIGKDIVYHHYLFLPAMRMGMDGEYKLPDYIPTRGHLTLQSRKISKSRDWYIGLKEFLEAYPADYLRFYLVSINPYSQDDLNFDWDDFATRINSELIGNLGNFVNRCLGFASKVFGGRVPEHGEPDQMDVQAKERIDALANDVRVLMEQNHLDRALKKILGFSSYFNQYFQHKEPWKDKAADQKSSAASCIYYSINAVKSLAIAIMPFMPDAAQKMWDQLGFASQDIAQSVSWDEISVLGVPPGHMLGEISPMFAKVEGSDIEEFKRRLGR